MENIDHYKELINEILRKQTDILGAEIALRIAGKVEGLRIGKDGQVADVGRDPQEVLRQLVNGYVALSGEIVKNILSPVFAKYPTIKLELK